MLRLPLLLRQGKQRTHAASFSAFSPVSCPKFRQGKTEYAWKLQHSTRTPQNRVATHSGTVSAERRTIAASEQKVSGKESCNDDCISEETWGSSGSTADGPATASSSASAGATAPGPSFAIPMVVRTESLWDRLQMLGMPRGYPHTCAPGFPRYFYLSVAASFTGNFAASIGTQTLLGGFFADSSARVWMLKDLAPAIFAAFVANKMISYELRPKFWLVVYALLNNTSTLADMFIPSMVPPQYLLAAAVLTSMAKQSALLMFFISRACALQHFATNNNLGEFTKKFNSFGMIMYTVATALGIAFTSLVPNFQAQLAAVLVCCTLNTWWNYECMRPIAFRIVNALTAHSIMRSFIQSNYSDAPTPEDVRKTLGLRGVVRHAPTEMTEMFCVSPAIHLLDLDRGIDEHLPVSHPSMPIAIGVCNVKESLREKFFRTCVQRQSYAARTFGDRMRVVLLVGSSCDTRHLLCGYLMAYAATMEQRRSVADLTSFLRECSAQHKLWVQKAEQLQVLLQLRGWDTRTLHLDPMDMRVSLMSDDGTWSGAPGSEEKAPEDDNDK